MKDLHIIINLFFAILFTVVLSNCTTYQRYQLSYIGVKEGDRVGARLFLVDSEHDSTEVWAMRKSTFSDHEITCILEKLPEPKAKQITAIESKHNASSTRNKVLFYAKPALVQRIPANDTLIFDYHELDRIEAVEMNYKRSLVRSIPLLLVGFLGLIVFAVLITFNK